MAKPREPKQDALGSLTASFTSLLADSHFVIGFLICAALALTHAADPATSLVTKFADWLLKNEATKALGTFIKARLLQTVGLACYLVTVWMCAPLRDRTVFSIGAAAAAFLLPESSVYQYGAQCCAAALYFKTRRKDSRMLIIVAVAVLWFTGILAGN